MNGILELESLTFKVTQLQRDRHITLERGLFLSEERIIPQFYTMRYRYTNFYLPLNISFEIYYEVRSSSFFAGRFSLTYIRLFIKKKAHFAIARPSFRDSYKKNYF